VIGERQERPACHCGKRRPVQVDASSFRWRLQPCHTRVVARLSRWACPKHTIRHILLTHITSDAKTGWAAGAPRTSGMRCITGIRRTAPSLSTFPYTNYTKSAADVIGKLARGMIRLRNGCNCDTQHCFRIARYLRVVG